VAALDAGEEGWLPTASAIEVLEAGGLPVVPSRVVADAGAAARAAEELGYPVAVKALGRSRQARTEAGGLALDVHGRAELAATVDRMGASLGAAAWPAVIQPMAEPGVDVAVGIVDHLVVAPVLTLGPGGAGSEGAPLEAHVVPLTDVDAHRIVADLPLATLLGDAGRSALEDLVLRVAALVEQVPELVGLELNPVVVSEAGAAIADARVRLAPVDRNPLPPVRRL
jgi:succinyl-CoA synthetase beta subunit